MSLVRLEELWPHILCFFPFYDADGGNGTRVFLEDGQEETDRRKTKTLLEAMARIFAADLAALRYKYRGMLCHKGLVPLPLHLSMILVPLKVRRVQYKDHGATGYAVLDRVERVEAEPTGTPVSRVVLEGGRVLDCMEKTATVKKRLAEGLEVKEDYSRFHRGRGIFPVPVKLGGNIEGDGDKVVYHIHYHTHRLPEESRIFRAAETRGFRK